MALQTQNLVLLAMGVLQDTPPNAIQPPLVQGVHLRWSFPPELGFPWHGFYLFRRPHRAGTPLYLSSVLGNLNKGPLPTKTLPLPPYGQISSDEPLMLTDDFPPGGVMEFDLDGRTSTRFTFATDQLVRQVQASIGIRVSASAPPITKTCVDFSRRMPSTLPNPLTEQHVTFQVLDKHGKPRPVSYIRKVPGTGGKMTGLDGTWSLTISLPTPATSVQVTLTPLASSATVVAYNADGTTAGSATTQKSYGLTPEMLTLTGNAITRVVIQPHGEKPDEQDHDDDHDHNHNHDDHDHDHDDDHDHNHNHDDHDHDHDDDQIAGPLLNQFCFVTGGLVSIGMTAFSDDVPVGQSCVWGQAGEVVSTSLVFDGITAVEFSSDAAALVDLGFVPLTQEATVGWQQIPGLTSPIRLPVTHPAYPCTPGTVENLEAARSLARQRIFYGDPKAFTASPTPITNVGSVTVVKGSPIVIGNNTNWSENLVDLVFQVKGDLTTYAVIQVISPTRLLLSRNYQGSDAQNAAYALNQDTFGQYYDHLLQLVSGGSAVGPMASRVFPAPIDTSGTTSVSQQSATVTGNGTDWSANLVGLAFQLSGDQTLYSIVDVPSPTQLTLDQVYLGKSQTGQAYQIIANFTGQQANSDTGAPPRLLEQSVLETVMLSTLQPAIAQMTGLYWVDQQAQPGTAYDYLVVADRDGSGNLDPGQILTLLQQSGFQTLDGYIVSNQQVAPVFPLEAPRDLRVYALPGSSRRNPDGTFQDANNNVGIRWDLATTEAGVLLPGGAIMYHLWRANLGNGTSPMAAGSYTPITQTQPILVATPELATGELPTYPPSWPPFPLHFIDSALPDGWYSYQVSGVDIFGRHSPNSAAGPWYEWVPVPVPRPWYYTDPPGDRVINPSAVRLLNKRVPPAPTGIEAYALDPADPLLLRDAAYNDWYKKLSDEDKKNLIGLRVRWTWTEKQVQQAPATSEFRIYFHLGRMNLLAGQISSVTFVPDTNGRESFVQTDIASAAAANAYAGAWLRCGSDSFAIVGSDAGSPLRLRVRTLGSSTAASSIAVTNDSATVTGQNTNWDYFALTGLSLQITGEQAVYTVLSVDSPTQLTLSQAYSGATGDGKAYTIFDIVPPSQTACTLAIPPTYNVGTITLAEGSSIVTGNRSNWNTTLVGMPFQVAGELATYTIVSVDAPTQLTLDRPYKNPNKSPNIGDKNPNTAERLYAIRFPLFVDDRIAANWQERYYVVGFNDHVTLTTDEQGRSLRRYEVFLPAPGDSYHQGVQLSPTRSDPIAYASIGVSAADNQPTTQDDPKWASGRWGNRPGNEGPLGPAATIFRLLREPLPIPLLPPPLDPEHATATAADEQGHSFYTYRWLPVAHLQAHLYRGLDETLFQVDWTQRPRSSSLDASQAQFFPDPATEPRWTQAHRQQVADELNTLSNTLKSFPHDTTVPAQAMAYYRGLSNDGLRVLAGLPGNEAAFSQLTREPLDPSDLANADRNGLDTPDSYVPDPNLRAYVDTLNGLTSNRYLYRLRYLDAAHNRSDLSLACPPVLVPKVVPPAPPTFTKVLGGDRQITLAWSSNREPDLMEYQVYRAESGAAAHDLSLMRLVHTEIVPSGDPTARTAEVSWADTGVVGRVRYYYRLVAVDQASNLSAPSQVQVGQAFDSKVPSITTDTLETSWDEASGTIRVSWPSSDPELICETRRQPGWSGHDIKILQYDSTDHQYTLDDNETDEFETYYYQVSVKTASGQEAGRKIRGTYVPH